MLNKDPKFHDKILGAKSNIFISMDNVPDKWQPEFWPKPDIIHDELYFSGDLH